MKFSREHIKSILDSKELLDFIKSRITPLLNNDSTVFTKRLELQSDYLTELEQSHLNSEEAKEVLEEELDRFTFYKTDGVIAGGSICNLINEYIYKISAKINDVDFFYYEFIGETTDSAYKERYENLVDEEVFLYKIEKIEDIGLLNKIKILPHDDFTWNYLLDSFDLNCCQVYINLNDNKIVYTDSFLDFLENRTIDLTPDFTAKNPLTTIIRGIIKKEETQSNFFSSDYLKAFISSYCIPIFDFDVTKFNIVTTDNNVSTADIFITAKRAGILMNRPDLLMPFFKLENNQLVLQDISQYPWATFFNDLFSIERNDERGMDEFISNISSVNLQTTFLNEKDIFYKKLMMLVKSNLFWNLNEIYTPEVLECLKKDFSTKDIDRLQLFLTQHQDITKSTIFLINIGYSIQDIIELYQFLKNIPLEELGVFESYFSDKQIFLEKGSLSHNSIFDKNVHNRFDDIIKKKNLPELRSLLYSIYETNLSKDKLCSPLPVSYFSSFVKEIQTQRELSLEGNRMRHCVGGYGNKIKAGHCRIFNINIGGKRSTLEIGIKKKTLSVKPVESTIPGYKDKEIVAQILTIRKERAKTRFFGLEYYIIQQRSSYNKDPISTHKKIAEKLVKFLNEKKVA